VFGMSRQVPSPYRGVQSTVRDRRVDRKFKSQVLRQIQTGADNAQRHAEEVRLGIAPGMKNKGSNEDVESGEED
jgi:hypothetical protein